MLEEPAMDANEVSDVVTKSKSCWRKFKDSLIGMLSLIIRFFLIFQPMAFFVVQI